MTAELTRIADRVSKSYRCPHLSADEINQEALIAAWRSQSTFDPAKGSWEIYAKACAHNLVMHRIKSPYSMRYLTGRGIRSTPIRRWAKHTSLVANSAAKHECHADEFARTDEIQHALARLRPRTRTIVWRYFFDGLTLHEIGRELGLTHQGVSECVKRALLQLREILGRSCPA